MQSRLLKIRPSGLILWGFVWYLTISSGFLGLIQSATAATSGPRPNIVLAIADDWGWPHAGSYGDRVVQTPTFDRLAREGMLFDLAFVSSPSCTPSRAALLTGQWHWRLEESANLHSTLQTRFPVYPDLLESAGYYIGLEKKGWGPGKHQVGGRTRNPAGPNVKDFATFLANRPKDTPFCFWFGGFDPHRPYEKGSGVDNGIAVDQIEPFPCFPNNSEVRSDIADYYFEVQRFDSDVAKIITQLEAIGELENTIVVMTGDHGMPFPRCKGNVYDSGARVPLAIRWGKQITPNQRSSALVSLIDLAPTFLEAAGVAIPEQMTGKSLLSLLTATPEELQTRDLGFREHILIGKERHVPSQEAPCAGGAPVRAIRTQHYLYIHNLFPDRWPMGTPNFEKAYFPGAWYADTDNGPTKSYIIEHRLDPEIQPLYQLCFGKRPAEELYDLRQDPHQLNNLAAQADYALVKERLAKTLQEELRATADPRVVGGGEKFEAYPYYGSGPRHPRLENAPKGKKQPVQPATK